MGLHTHSSSLVPSIAPMRFAIPLVSASATILVSVYLGILSIFHIPPFPSFDSLAEAIIEALVE
ncbi:hypothetical protein H5410_040965 [Solanum commersonii]|uniref:Uncharacterized protein n=1 Tax=Solanum commersonii TaxID=4109 RepID=A0A9J5XQA1_SOLCO|nr:hypothetical protein H5410_040965 [Solanum commersonii]